jgi:hypothetical protein
MADNVDITPGAGATIATDDAGAAGHVQLVKLAIATNGSATLIPADADGIKVNLGADNDVTVTGSVTANAGTNLNTSALGTAANQATIIGHLDGVEGSLTTIAGDTTDIEAAVELIDDTVAVLGTDTYTEATTKGLIIGAVRRDADTTLVGTTNEIGPLQLDANGRLKVEAFSGETLPVSLTSTTVTGTVAVTQSGTWDEVGINDSGNSITVDYATTGSGTATGALRVELANNGTGVLATVGAVTAITNALPAGTNAIGKLAANSGVDIGDVDVLSVPLPTLAATGTVTSVNDTASSTTLLSSGATRKGFRIFNDSTQRLYVKYGTTASATDFTVRVEADGYLEENHYYGRVDGIWAADGSGAARITELT